MTPAFFFTPLVAVAPLSHAAVIFTHSTNALPMACLNHDLTQTSLESTTWQQNNWINNGTTGSFDSHNSQDPANVTTTGIKDFVLDLAASPLGYDISRIDSFSGWLDARAGQSYSIFFKAVGSSEFTQITPGGSGNDAVSVAASGQSLVTRVFDDSSDLLGTGVGVIRFNVGYHTRGNVWREVDVIGTPTIPEPSSLLFLGLASLGLLRRKNRTCS